MYSELLDKDSYNASYIVEAVLENLCEDTKTELKKIYGEFDYLEKAFKAIKSSYIYVVKLLRNNQPVGLYGLIEEGCESAGIFLLTTDDLHKGNVITFIKGAKKQVDEWSKKYKLIMDNCYKQNTTIQKWLRLLGFKKSEYQDENFQIYYKGDISLYNEGN
jgi:hypothetical protein